MARLALKVLFILLLLTFALTVVAAAQEPQSQNQGPKIDWQRGPMTAHLGTIATIKIPEGYAFADKHGAEQILTLTQNIPHGNELGVVVSKGAAWFMIFRFEDVGYIKDDDKDNLDADAILKTVREGTDTANEQRRKNGWPALHVVGWQRQPYYDDQTHNLTWAILGKGDDPNDTGSVNHRIRILGRSGTMSIDLVASPSEYAASVASFNSLISGFSYVQGNRYSDFRAGDKVAKYGLAALIAGGTGAVLLKTGLLAKFWKLIVVGFAALIGLIKKLFSSIFGSKEIKIEDPNKQAASQG